MSLTWPEATSDDMVKLALYVVNIYDVQMNTVCNVNYDFGASEVV